MHARPTLLTIVGWILIVMAALSVVGTLMAAGDPATGIVMRHHAFPIAAQQAIACVGAALVLAAGVGVLKGRNWARWLYLTVGAGSLLLDLATSPARLLVVPNALLLVALAAVLFGPAANAFFRWSASADVDDKDDLEEYRPAVSPLCWRALRLIGRLLGVVTYTIAGLQLAGTLVIAFQDRPLLADGLGLGYNARGKLEVMVGGVILAAAAIVVASLLRRSPRWKTIVGAVVLSAVGVTALAMIRLVCLRFSPAMYGVGSTEMFCDYFTGGVCMLLLAAVGVAFIVGGREPDAEYAFSCHSHHRHLHRRRRRAAGSDSGILLT